MLPEFDNTEIAFEYRNDKELKRARFLFSSMSSPMLTNLGMAATKLAINWGLPVKSLIKKTLFDQFCGGENMEEAAQTAALLGKYNVGVILDYGVEGKGTEAEFDKAVPEFVKAIKYAATQKNIPFISLKVTGFARFTLLKKLHAAEQLTEDEKAEWQKVVTRINTVCAAAFENKIMVLVDAEETWIQHPVNELAEAMMEKYNKQEAIVFNTFQFYSHLSLPYLLASFEKATAKGYVLGAKLVRGAYMEKERARAKAMNYRDPIQPNKTATDQDYNSVLIFCLDNIDKLALFIGTHNEDSCMLAAKYLEDHNIPHNNKRVYFSQLFGMSDNISFNLGHEGYNVAKYLPYGPVKDVIPYLLRRAQENTSVSGQTSRELSLIVKECKRRGI